MSDLGVRTHHRHTLSLHMEVYRKANDKEPLFKCRTRNIGPGGTMIRNRGVKLRKGARIKLLLKATFRSKQNQFEIEAKVLWETPTSIGFEFYPTKISKQQEFKRFLFKAKVGTHERARKRWNDNNITATVISQKSV